MNSLQLFWRGNGDDLFLKQYCEIVGQMAFTACGVRCLFLVWHETLQSASRSSMRAVGEFSHVVEYFGPCELAPRLVYPRGRGHAGGVVAGEEEMASHLRNLKPACSAQSHV